MSNATPEDMSIMLHALGGNGRLRPGWRNHYCTRADDPWLLSMVERGLMVAGFGTNGGRDRYFHVSPAWCKALGAEETK